MRESEPVLFLSIMEKVDANLCVLSNLGLADSEPSYIVFVRHHGFMYYLVAFAHVLELGNVKYGNCTCSKILKLNALIGTMCTGGDMLP